MLKPFVLSAVVCSLASLSWGQSLLNTSFESSEGFVTGPLNSGSTSQLGWLVTGLGGTATGNVGTTNPRTGTQALTIDSNPLTSASYWFKPLNANLSGKVVKVSWAMRLNQAGSPTLENSSQYGMLLFDGAGEMLTGALMDNLDASLLYWNQAGQTWSPMSAVGTRNQYVQLAIYINYVNGRTTFEVNGNRQSPFSYREGSNFTLGDCSIHCRYATTDSAQFDDLSVESYLPGRIQGQVVPLNYGGSPHRPITIEVRNPGSQTPLYTSTLVPAADGSFSVSTGLSGTYDIAVKGKTHLRKVLPNVVLEAEGISGLVWTLFNGDVNNDNIIDIADYTYLALAFDADQSNPAWSVPDSQGVALQDSDLNGDGIVDIADYTILATNFDGVGQP